MADPALLRMILKTVLSAPNPILRGVAGGGVVWRGGRTLDPKLQFLWKAWFKPRPLTEVTPEEARAGWSELVAAMGLKPPKGVKSETILLDGPAGALTTRLHRPADQDLDAPLLVWFHGGGGVVGDLDTCDGICALLAAETRSAVLAPAYRLAPEERFPAGYEDAEAALAWAAASAERYGALGVAVGGESVGAAFAAALCQAAVGGEGPQPGYQLLICPLLDAAAGDLGSMKAYGDLWPLTREGLDWLLGHYLGPEADPGDTRLSPLRAASVEGLAPAVIVSAGFDPLGDQAVAYARRLRDAGVPMRLRVHDGLTHAFPAFAGVVPAAAAACRDAGREVRAMIEAKAAPKAA